MPHSWIKLDNIMQQFSPKLRDDLGLTPPVSNCLATTIASEVLALPHEVLRDIRDKDTVGLQRRIDELIAFEHFMDFATQIQTTSGSFAPLTRAQVVCQLYTVFVYLGDACFSRLRKSAASGTALKKCCRYLTDYPVRGLRNAVAHSCWRYTDDFTGIIFYYFKDEQKTKQSQYTVNQLELDFWDKLARVTAYATFQTINEIT
ncbi:MAG: hypothetical protein QME64_03430 [bacterium]|nr:hypothetical protein [bacterium]